ncbi:UNVERIFIED_CONTAM: hypothetical protein FKN15_000495 [Acipenser sinensis]
MAAHSGVDVPADPGGADLVPNQVTGTADDSKRPQFGTRFLTDPSLVFQHNAWDNVEWSEDQEAAARRKVLENAQPLPTEKQDEYESRANEFWNGFYKHHENRFFKDRHWLFTEFPELVPNRGAVELEHRQAPSQGQGDGRSSTQLKDHNSAEMEQANCSDKDTMILTEHDFPGSSATYRILETHLDYTPERCFAFVHDLCDETTSFPVPKESLDVIILIFVLSAVHPDKMQNAVSRLSELLKPGGMILLRDYGRYDMAQLRFKKDELGAIFTRAGLEKVQNLVDRRLQVNRGKQLTMYRIWIQCKYRKPQEKTGSHD